MSGFIRALQLQHRVGATFRSKLGLSKQQSVPCADPSRWNQLRYGIEAAVTVSIPFEAKMKRIIQEEIDYQSHLFLLLRFLSHQSLFALEMNLYLFESHV